MGERLANQPTPPEFPPHPPADEPELDFGPQHKLPYVTVCRFCSGLHLDQRSYEQCRADTVGGW